MHQASTACRGRAAARANASRTTRSTPYLVLTLFSVATSCGVPLPQRAADPDVRALGALADDHHVDVARRHAGEWCRDARVELDRPQVDRVLEGEPQLEQQAPLEHAGRARSGRRRHPAGSRRARAAHPGRCPAASRRCGGSARRPGRSRSSRPHAVRLDRGAQHLQPSATTSGPIPSPPMTAIRALLLTMRDPTDARGERRSRYSPEIRTISTYRLRCDAPGLGAVLRDVRDLGPALPADPGRGPRPGPGDRGVRAHRPRALMLLPIAISRGALTGCAATGAGCSSTPSSSSPCPWLAADQRRAAPDQLARRAAGRRGAAGRRRAVQPDRRLEEPVGRPADGRPAGRHRRRRRPGRAAGRHHRHDRGRSRSSSSPSATPTGPLVALAPARRRPEHGVVTVSLGAHGASSTRRSRSTSHRTTSAARWSWSVITLAVVCTALAFLVFFALIADIGPTRATVITYVNPAVAIALGRDAARRAPHRRHDRRLPAGAASARCSPRTRSAPQRRSSRREARRHARLIALTKA